MQTQANTPTTPLHSELRAANLLDPTNRLHRRFVP
jgi:hypothetical protein